MPMRSDYDDSEPAVEYKRKPYKPEPMAWSPPTPPVRLEPWASGPRWQISEAVQKELDALKAKLAPGKVDNELERRYLDNLKSRRESQRA